MLLISWKRSTMSMAWTRVSFIWVRLISLELKRAAMLASLPAVTAGTLTLTGNYGAGELSEAEIAAAEAKGWTVST